MGAIRLDKDAALVGAVSAGDRDAFDALVARHWGYVYGLAFRMSGDRDAAEDICVEAFCAAYRSLPRFRPQARFRTWLHQVAVNVCLHYLRQERVQHAYLPQTELPEELPAQEDPCEKALVQACAEQVQQVIAGLPHAQQQAMWLFYFEHRTCPEIAELLHVPCSTVRTRLFYGTRAVRESLNLPADAASARGGPHADV